jgi:hypothetical protein
MPIFLLKEKNVAQNLKKIQEDIADQFKDRFLFATDDHIQLIFE